MSTCLSAITTLPRYFPTIILQAPYLPVHNEFHSTKRCILLPIYLNFQDIPRPRRAGREFIYMSAHMRYPNFGGTENARSDRKQECQ